MVQAQTLRSILDEIKSLEPLPQVALRVMAMAGEEDLVPRDLVEVIQTDAGLTAKILKLANSAYYGFRREIVTLFDAGNLLGTSKLINLALTTCSARYFRSYGGQSEESARRTWERSVTTAIASGLLARTRGGVERSRAYTAGLLENVGQVVLARFLPEASSELETVIAAGATRLEAEEEVLGLHHGEIGARLAERWNFPPVLVETIRHHHQPERAQLDVLLVSYAHLGELITQQKDGRDGHAELPYELSPTALDVAGMTRGDFDAFEDVLRDEVERARELVELA
jgi:HD-like signal output (HDOD) protein